MLNHKDVTSAKITETPKGKFNADVFNAQGEMLDSYYAPTLNDAKSWIREYLIIEPEIILQNDCPNCADQASIAAPGETVLCETPDEKHYREMYEFFEEEIERLQFKALLPFCSACGTYNDVVYVGLMPTENSGILNFSFCIDCRDNLTLKKNAAIATQERIGT